jgi:aminopeptidase
MLYVDYGAIARKMVHDALHIRKGEIVSVSGGLHTLDLLEEIIFQVRCAGAFTLSEIVTDRLSRRLAFEVPLEHLQAPPPPSIRKMEMTDCLISIGGSEDPLLLSALPEERGKAMARASLPIMKIMHEKKKERRLRTLGMGFPTQMRAGFFGMPFEDYHDLFWRAVLIDLRAMRERQRVIAALVRDTKVIRITSAKGTDITLSNMGRAVHMDSGIFEEEDFASGNLTTNWPCGEVWMAPREESAEGVAVFDSVRHRGLEIVDLRLTFREGKVIDFSAKERGDLFASMLREEEGDADRIGELGIGTNPEVTRVTGDTLMDEKIIGTVHLALGDNRGFGGTNASTMHKDMVILEPSLYAGDTPLILEGELCL